jgi:hypothetical protein
MRRSILFSLFCLPSLCLAQPDSLHVIWDKRGYGEQSHFGGQVWGLGDQNDDGYADFAVLSSGTGPAGQESERRFDFFRGGNPPDTMPYVTFTRDSSTTIEFASFYPFVCGDLNGDGYQDWWLWFEPRSNPDTIITNIYWGGPMADTIPDAVFRLPATGLDGMGQIGDINGDGYDDFYLYLGSGIHDETYIFFGGTLLDTIPDLVINSNPPGSQSALPRAIGDLSGDGYSDFVTATNMAPSIAYIYLGGNPPATTPAYTWPNFYIGWPPLIEDLNADHRGDLVIPRSLHMDVHFGGDTVSAIANCSLTFPGCDHGPQEVDNAGDINGDGFGDLTAISDCDLGLGALRLYLGHPWLNPDPVISIDGDEPPLYLVGILHAVGVGDINGDGIEDLAIGATNEMTYHEGQRGRVVILSGDTTLRAGADEPRAGLARELSISVFPNPFNATTTLRYAVPVSAQVKLSVYNILGQKVATLVDGVQQAGCHAVTWNGTNVASGIYIYRLQASGRTLTHKMLLMK